MKLNNSHAGTLESGDILIQIFPSDGGGIDIELESSVAYQFGDRIKEVITETIQGMGVSSARINATDKGALDCTIRARVAAAVVRATGQDVWKD